MSPEPHSSPGRRRAWRVATPLVVLVSGTLFGVSAQQSDGPDLRGGRLTDLASVVRAERDETGDLTAEAASLNAEVEALSAGLGDRSVARVQDEIATLVDPAGLTEKAGAAVQVTLDDATFEARAAYEDDPNDLVVHQQDIQAVANAMWNAGAVAVTIQGQRLISTTGIKCEGNQVTLQRPALLAALRHRRHRRPRADPGRADRRPDPRDLPRVHHDPRRRRVLGHDRARVGRRPGLRRAARPHLRHPAAGVSRRATRPDRRARR